MNALCPIALNVDFFRYSAIIIIVLKLNPYRSEIILFVIMNPNNAFDYNNSIIIIFIIIIISTTHFSSYYYIVSNIVDVHISCYMQD